MLFFDNVGWSWLMPSVCFAADKGGGGDGGGDPDNDPDPDSDPDSVEGDEKIFSKKEHEDQLGRNRQAQKKKMDRALETKDKELADLQAKLEEAEKKPAVVAPDRKEGIEGELELLKTRHKKELNELRGTVEEEKKARQAAELQRKEAERDQLINSALIGAKCLDQVGGYRYSLPLVGWDSYEDDERGILPGWKIKTPGKGSFVDITAENMRDILPDYLKRPLSEDGGSGTRGGIRTPEGKRSKLELEKRKLEEAHSLANKTRRSEHVSAYQKQKQKVKKLEADFVALNQQ